MNQKKIILLGSNGLIGSKLFESLSLHHEVSKLQINELDHGNLNRHSILINATGNTNLNAAIDKLQKDNLNTVKQICELVRHTSCHFFHFSSETALIPDKNGIIDAGSSLNLNSSCHYAKTKAQAEKIIIENLPQDQFTLVYPGFVIGTNDHKNRVISSLLSIRSADSSLLKNISRDFISDFDLASAMLVGIQKKLSGRQFFPGQNFKLSELKRLLINFISDEDLKLLSNVFRSSTENFIFENVSAKSSFVDMQFEPKHTVEEMIKNYFSSRNLF